MCVCACVCGCLVIGRSFPSSNSSLLCLGAHMETVPLLLQDVYCVYTGWALEWVCVCVCLHTHLSVCLCAHA